MIKAICKYYLQFPPIARTAINFSLNGFMGYAGVDYYHASSENILIEFDILLNSKNK